MGAIKISNVDQHEKEIMEMLEEACRHLTRMEQDAEYRAEVEKRLYAGPPPELLERIRARGKRFREAKQHDQAGE